jgi:hypothetical protein
MIAGLVEALATQLCSDAQLSDWARRYCKQPTIAKVFGNRSLFDSRGAFVLQREVPALIFDFGNAEINTGPGAQLSMASWPINVGMVWREQCPDTAFTARSELPRLLLNALHTDPLLGGASSGAVITEISPRDIAADLSVRVVEFVVSARLEHRTGT